MLTLREATPQDAAAIAKLHADSWRSAYPGMLSDEYLDDRVHLERAAVWRQRFSAQAEKPFFVLFVALAASAPLLQNWFAASGHPRAANPYVLYSASNLGSFVALLTYPFLVEPLFTLHAQVLAWSVSYALLIVLIAAAARLLADKRSGGLYLWVMEQNARARQFYARAGAVEVECEKLSMPDGSMCMEMRCYWPDLKSVLTTGGNHLL